MAKAARNSGFEASSHSQVLAHITRF